MKKIYTTLFILVSLSVAAQKYKFYYSNFPKFLVGTDTMAFPFTGGVNAPQFSNTDFNNDGVKDLFVFDRATSKVLCFVWSNGKFEHAPQYEAAFPFMRNWALLRDFNGDGKEDIFTEIVDDERHLVDTNEVFANGMRLIINNGTPQLAYKILYDQVKDTGRSGMGFPNPIPNFTLPPRNVLVNNIDIPALDDMDNDGDIDVLSFQGQDLSPAYVENFKTNRFGIQYPANDTRFILRDFCWGGIQYAAASGRNKFNIHFRREDLSSCQYRLYGKQMMKHAGTTCLMLDMNNDGVKDLIYGDVGYNNLIILYNGRLQNPSGIDSIVTQDTVFPRNTTPANFINFPAPYYVDIDNDAKNDLLVTTNNAISAANTNNVWIYQNTGTQASPTFNYTGNNFFLYQQTIDFGARTVPLLHDIDNDGDKDLFVATSGNFAQTFNTKDAIVYYKNTGTANKPVYVLEDSSFANIGQDTAILEMHPTFGDLNADGKSDLVIGNANGRLEYFVNQSSGNTINFSIVTRALGNIDIGNNATPQLVDLNKDGRIDLIVGNRNGKISYFQNTGTITQPSFSSTPTIDSLGGIVTRETYLSSGGFDRIDPQGFSTPHVCELDGDTATTEMLVGMWNGKIWAYENVSAQPGASFTKRDSLFAFTAQNEGRSILFGMRSAPYVANMDSDDRADVIIGNLGGGLNFYASIPTEVEDTTGENSLPELSKGKLVLYPNPATQSISFDTYLLPQDGQATIINIVGQTLKVSKVNHFEPTVNIDVADLPNGIYFIEVKSGNQLFVSRFLISK
jgi:hypothetical protein